MSATATPDLASLGQRIADLEAIVAGGQDALQPNVITVAPDGTIGVDIPGGVRISEVSGNPGAAPAGRAVTFLRQGDGAVIAQLFTEDNGGSNDAVYLTTNPAAIPGDVATRRELDLDAWSPDQQRAALLTISAPNAPGVPVIFAQVGTRPGAFYSQAVVLDGQGQSNFLQLPTSQRLQLTIGTGSITFSSSQQGGPTVVTHGLGRAPTIAAAWVQAGSTGTTVFALSTGSFTATQFQVFGTANLAVNGSLGFGWLAIG